MEASFRELYTHSNLVHTLNAVKILSPHELCLTYEKGVELG